jgi:vacuolar-type H+-ATPase subunit I/STV1
MSNRDLLRQAENAERHADQTADEEMKATLKKAAEHYRDEASAPYALFRGQTQLGKAYSSHEEVRKAALAEGLVPEDEELPAGYRIQQVAEHYDPRPEWKLPKEIS